jgi:MOSC domain-containing protein YiiM
MDGETMEGLGLAHGEVRENITTAGVELASLEEGRRLALGEEVVLRITGPCAPCSRMDEIRPGLQHELEARRGMLATVAQGGTIRVGDGIQVLESAQTAP